MPRKSLREIRADLKRQRTERLVDALLVVQAHDGTEVFRCGGIFDTSTGRYVRGAKATPRVVRLQESQLDLARGFARWLNACRRGDPKRPRLIMAGGNRGSGKTFFLGGIALVAVALEFPHCWQFAVNLTGAQRRECVEAIDAIVGPKWIAYHSDNPVEQRTKFATGAYIGWLSAQNPKRLRQGGLPIRHVLLNEAQDQAERNYTNAIGSIRNKGGLVTVATNPPQSDSGDWVASVWNGVQSDEAGHRGEVYQLNNKLNAAVDQVALDDIAVLLRLSSPEAAAADAGGDMRLAGPVAYKPFIPLPVGKGGHIGDPPNIGWRDVTRERTAELMKGGAGFDWVIGADFQRRPGIIGIVCKLFVPPPSWWEEHKVPQPIDPLVMWAAAQVNCAGDESAFSDALERAGYTPVAADKNSALIVGDGTGARQNGAHNWSLPPSFEALKREGWVVIPPRYTRKRKPENPTVKESRSQMWAAFTSFQLLVSPALKGGEEGFTLLIEALRRAKVNPNTGSLVGGYHHAPDGFRYPWWVFGPKPTPPKAPQTSDPTVADPLRGIRLFGGG